MVVKKLTVEEHAVLHTAADHIEGLVKWSPPTKLANALRSIADHSETERVDVKLDRVEAKLDYVYYKVIALASTGYWTDQEASKMKPSHNPFERRNGERMQKL